MLVDGTRPVPSSRLQRGHRLDQLGRPSTEKLHVIERFRRTDFGHMKIDVTIDDPGAYTRPWTVSEEVHLRPGWEPGEFICGENNKDVYRWQ